MPNINFLTFHRVEEEGESMKRWPEMLVDLLTLIFLSVFEILRCLLRFLVAWSFQRPHYFEEFLSFLPGCWQTVQASAFGSAPRAYLSFQKVLPRQVEFVCGPVFPLTL